MKIVLHKKKLIENDCVLNFITFKKSLKNEGKKMNQKILTEWITECRNQGQLQILTWT